MEGGEGEDNLNVKGGGLLNNRENGWSVLPPSPMHIFFYELVSLGERRSEKDIRMFVKYRFW